MSKTITIRLDDDLAEMLELVLEGCQETKSQIIRDALRRHFSIRLHRSKSTGDTRRSPRNGAEG
jgi:predicted transcriptional regulator